jgi:hypothetical protein
VRAPRRCRIALADDGPVLPVGIVTSPAGASCSASTDVEHGDPVTELQEMLLQTAGKTAERSVDASASFSCRRP